MNELFFNRKRIKHDRKTQNPNQIYDFSKERKQKN